ncbi:MAG: diaminopimelate decarboxylase [Bacteroidota bacterium]|nr:diaminopimelate decarboxylase [Bacteroidota bacterium]
MQLINGKYHLDGVDLIELTQEFDTPVYVYSANKMAEQVDKLNKAFPGVKLGLHYACKALSNINVLRYMKKLGTGLDAVSIQEVWLGLKAGFEPDQILYTPNGVSMEEIDMAVKEGVKINIDNISILEQFGAKYGRKVPVCIRVNPHIMAGGNAKISTGHIDSKFGISYYQLRHVDRVVKLYDINVEGLHMHTGSDILDAEVFLRGAELLFEAAIDFKELKYMDFGSGFKVAYKENDITTDINDIGHQIAERFINFCSKYGKELELWFEPGKFLVSESGYFLVKTNVVKQTTSTMFAGVDSGLNHLIRPMLYDAYHKITNISNPSGVERIYAVVGYICETDTFGWDRKLNEVREGDILAFHNAGAYGISMASNYNSRFRPAEVLIIDGKAHLIRRRETIEDILNTQVDIKL